MMRTIRTVSLLKTNTLFSSTTLREYVMKCKQYIGPYNPEGKLEYREGKLEYREGKLEYREGKLEYRLAQCGWIFYV